MFTAALRARGVPVHVLGIAGLLDQPVIADLVCVLRVLHDPTAGSELVRVLGGARWRIGPADLAALHGLARWLADRDLARRRLDDDVRRGLRASIAPDESPSIVDALDFLLTAPDGHSALRGFSEIGLARMRRAGAQLQSLRRRAGLGLVDFVHLVQQELLLDIEVAANAAQPLGAPSLEAFDELLAGFADVAEHPTLGAFLGWLTEAEQRDRLAPRQDEPEPGAVQVLSIHGSKGLEWDLVAIPRLVDEELPSKPRSTKGWLAFGELPNDFKGDRDELPELQWRGVQSQAEFDEAVRAFADENRERHADEERRLAYVALTRTRAELLLSGSWWSHAEVAAQAEPVPPRARGRGHPRARCASLRPRFRREPARERAPRASGGRSTRSAPGDRRYAWPPTPCAPPPNGRAAWASARGSPTSCRLLLEERRRRFEGPGAPPIPARVPASRFKDYVDDPAAVAAQLRRPMPQRPYRATRIGTLFHEWVEHRSTGEGEASAIDDGWPSSALDDDRRPTRSIADATPERLRALQATFEASEWGGRKPIAVELELHLPIDEHVFVCKLDAVYDVPPGGELAARGIRHQVVDWKTGTAPRDARDLELKQTQLALYRLAYANWAGVDPETVDAVFYFVEDDRVIRPDRLYDEAALRRSWASVAASAARGDRVALILGRRRGRGIAPVAQVERDRRGGVHRHRGRSPASRRSSSEKS